LGDYQRFLFKKIQRKYRWHNLLKKIFIELKT